MRASNILATALAAAILLRAADFWTATHPARWSKQDIERMVTNSPWAKQASVQIKGSDVPPLIAGSTPPAAPATPQILVRWDSALPVCEACEKGGLERPLFSCTSKLLYLSGLSRKFAELAKDFYVVSMSNYPKPVSEWREDPQHSPAATAALERIAQRIQQAALLKPKGRTAIAPAHAVALPAGHVLLVMVFFSRTAPLTIEDKEVSFESSDGTIEIRSKFDLRRMVYNGKLEL
jgi:hypothetical protein